MIGSRIAYELAWAIKERRWWSAAALPSTQSRAN